MQYAGLDREGSTGVFLGLDISSRFKIVSLPKKCLHAYYIGFFRNLRS